MTEIVAETRDLQMHFGVGSVVASRRAIVRAVDHVSLQVRRGEVLAVVGESGSGKSTLAYCITRLLAPTGGQVLLHGHDVTRVSRRRLRDIRREVNIVFQDPYSSLNPRMDVRTIVSEPLRLHRLMKGDELADRTLELLESVRLDPDIRFRYAHELSGGQRQRVAIARALATRPSLLVADEPTSSLDVSSQAAIINLLLDLQTSKGFSVLFITHNLSLAEFLADRIAVMYLGRIVEIGDARSILADPKHPYTQALLSAAPVPDATLQRSRRRIVLSGDVPNPMAPPSGCVFHPRCPVAVAICSSEVPDQRVINVSGRAPTTVACHRVGDDGNGPVLIFRETSAAVIDNADSIQ